MRLALPRVALVLALLPACGDKDPADADDSGAPLYGGDGADGTGGADGTDGTGGSDGTEVSGSCDTGTAADLVFALRASASGTPCSTCPADAPVLLEAVVHNPCPDALDLYTRSSCLTNSVTVENAATGEGAGGGSACAGVETWTEIPGGGELTEWLWEERFSAGTWVATVRFEDEGFTEASTTFTVE